MFLSLIPKDLKFQLQEIIFVDRIKHVGLLKITNALLERNLKKNVLYCLAVAFGFKPSNLAGVLILQSKVAVKNYNRKNDVDDNGKRIRYDNIGYKRRRQGILRTYNKRRNLLTSMRCLLRSSRRE
uniref:Uncharacterized protein n=1 Tax=Strongyloides venezuelensis TaxID=75913 RepID=A0A0K0FI23_STRVS